MDIVQHTTGNTYAATSTDLQLGIVRHAHLLILTSVSKAASLRLVKNLSGRSWRQEQLTPKVPAVCLFATQPMASCILYQVSACICVSVCVCGVCVSIRKLHVPHGGLTDSLSCWRPVSWNFESTTQIFFLSLPFPVSAVLFDPVTGLFRQFCCCDDFGGGGGEGVGGGSLPYPKAQPPPPPPFPSVSLPCPPPPTPHFFLSLLCLFCVI